MDSGEKASFQITYKPAGKRERRIESPYFEARGAAALGLSLCHGADFILYGPIGNAPLGLPQRRYYQRHDRLWRQGSRAQANK